MKKYLIILSVLVCFVGCCSYKNVPYVVYRNNEIDEFIGPMKDYCIYDFISQVKMRRDTEVYFPAHYHILFPPKRGIKNILGYNDNRCFIYTKSRGIAIFQDHYSWERKYTNGFRQIPADSADRQLSLFDEQAKIKVNEQKCHYLYVDNEIRIVFFNLSRKDYHSFVELPLNSLKIRRRGEVIDIRTPCSQGDCPHVSRIDSCQQQHRLSFVRKEQRPTWGISPNAVKMQKFDPYRKKFTDMRIMETIGSHVSR